MNSSSAVLARQQLSLIHHGLFRGPLIHRALSTAAPVTIALELDAIYDLSFGVLSKHGSCERQSHWVSKTIVDAERDGCASHGLFRLPGYIYSLQSGKVKGNPAPKVVEMDIPSPCVIRIDGDCCFAPLALHEYGLPKLIDVTKKFGVGVLRLNNVHHFAALFHETEALAQAGLVGLACTNYKPAVAPSNAIEAFYGTNPISFAYPRLHKDPVVYDMATSTMAMGEVEIAARDNKSVERGTGLSKGGELTTKPEDILDGGVLLPFGGHKGSAISLMVELLTGGLAADNFSYQSQAEDNNDGGPARGGQFVLAMSPELIAGKDWNDHSEEFFATMKALKPGNVRLPGERRHVLRASESKTRQVNKSLLDTIYAL